MLKQENKYSMKLKDRITGQSSDHQYNFTWLSRRYNIIELVLDLVPVKFTAW